MSQLYDTNYCKNRFIALGGVFDATLEAQCLTDDKERIKAEVCRADTTTLTGATCTEYCRSRLAGDCEAVFRSYCNNAAAVASKPWCLQQMTTNGLTWGRHDNTMLAYCNTAGQGKGTAACSCLDNEAIDTFFSAVDEPVRSLINSRPDCFFGRCSTATGVYKNASQAGQPDCISVTVCANKIKNVTFRSGASNNLIIQENNCSASAAPAAAPAASAASSSGGGGNTQSDAAGSAVVSPSPGPAAKAQSADGGDADMKRRRTYIAVCVVVCLLVVSASIGFITLVGGGVMLMK